ncbi:MAG TPA: isochorismatase family cysteine hydrolase [Deferrisomatales bacterium]|nr:isochorismatase family cysteine hydrolase [Deferrisomatales bacterium]
MGEKDSDRHLDQGCKNATENGGDVHLLFDQQGLITRHFLYAEGIVHTVNMDPWFVNMAKQSRDGRLNAYDTLEAHRTALVVVDMQHYFLTDGMPACVPEARTIVPNINRLAQALRAAGGTVIWIQTEARIADPQDWANRQEAMSAAGWAKRQTLLARSGDGFPLYPTCEVLPEDKIAIKYRYSAFIPYPSELDGLLRTHGIDTLLITGVATSTCCESTARDAAMWGYRTIMVSDGNADQTDALHNHTLGKFLVTFGDVQTTDEVLAKLGAAEEARSRNPQPADLAARP